MHRGLIALVALVASLAAPAGASALTLGVLDPGADPGPGDYCVGTDQNYIQGTVAPGSTGYTVPQGGGTITSWSTRYGTTGSAVALEVWRSDPHTSGNYFLIAKDARTLAPAAGGVSSYSTSIPVQAGDLIGIFFSANSTVACAYTTPNDADTIWGMNGTPSVGGELDFESFIVTRDRLNLQANLQQTADVGITQIASRPTVVAGNAVEFVLNAIDNGPSPQTATVVDTLPPGMTFFSAVAGGGSCSGGQTVTCEVPLSVGGSQTISVVAVASAAGAHTNTATISSSATDPAPANNSSSATVQVISVPTLGKVSKKLKQRRETFKFALDQAATVKVLIERSGKQVQSIFDNGAPGSNSVRTKKLSPGHYKAVFTAGNAAGTSASRTVSFTVR